LWRGVHTGTVVEVLAVLGDDVMFRYRRSGGEWALTLLDFVRRYDFATSSTEQVAS
jgi:hypothetical protein